MRAVTVALAAALALAGCGSGSDTGPIVGKVLERLRPGDAPAAPAAPGGGGGGGLTRAAVEASGSAMIRGRLVDERARSVLVAASGNGGYVTYLSRLGQSLTLRGSLVTASRGLGFDLISVAAEARDPLVTPTPPDRWPERVRRTYRFPAAGPEGALVTVTCRYEPEGVLEITIVEVTHRGRQMAEYCAGDGVSFKNLHFADLASGFVWRSLQWLGPEQGSIDLEIVEPVTP